MMDKSLLCMIICFIVGVGIVITFIGITWHDLNVKSERLIDSISCEHIKILIIDEQDGLIMKNPHYNIALEKWNSDECEYAREP